MTEKTDPQPERPPTGIISDFVYGGASKDEPLFMEVAIKEDGRVVLFHNKPFKNELSWLEFDLGTNELDFVLDDGEIRDLGIPLKEDVAKHMQNSHQILMVLLDDVTGEAKEGNYIPLIIRRD
ncbi:MAG: hypothetical protein DHS20C02_00640 [Micavibrio sp.]|nr:MAG: hypothetical protein DHS20C02_00640 [Micavibrio sp.]